MRERYRNYHVRRVRLVYSEGVRIFSGDLQRTTREVYPEIVSERGDAQGV